MKRFLVPAAAANMAATAPARAVTPKGQATTAAADVAVRGPLPAQVGAPSGVAAAAAPLKPPPAKAPMASRGAAFAATLRRRTVVHEHRRAATQLQGRHPVKLSMTALRSLRKVRKSTLKGVAKAAAPRVPPRQALEAGAGAMPMMQMLQVVRERAYLTMIQAGGAYRDAGVKSLRKSMAAAGGPSDFLRYCAHPGNKVEHHFRIFDATSRCHFLGAQHYAQSERHSLVCHLARCVLLVDPAPVRAFYAHLEALQWPTDTQAFSDALDAGLAAHGGDRPRAYKPWGRGLPSAHASGAPADGSEDEDADHDEVGVDYASRRGIVKSRLLEVLDTPPGARCRSLLSYTAPSLQRLAGVHEREGPPQFRVMQVMMDLVLSACKAQRKKAWLVRKAFYMAGSGCLVKGDMGAITAFEQAAKTSSTFKKQCAVLHQRCTVLDMWFFCEHASCAIRKYSKKKNRQMMAMEECTLDSMVNRYCDPAKEAEYQQILEYVKRL